MQKRTSEQGKISFFHFTKDLDNCKWDLFHHLHKADLCDTGNIYNDKVSLQDLRLEQFSSKTNGNLTFEYNHWTSSWNCWWQLSADFGQKRSAFPGNLLNSLTTYWFTEEALTCNSILSTNYRHISSRAVLWTVICSSGYGHVRVCQQFHRCINTFHFRISNISNFLKRLE